MSEDYLTRWARRALGQIPTVEPRVLPPFLENGVPLVEELATVDVTSLLALPCLQDLRQQAESEEEGGA